MPKMKPSILTTEYIQTLKRATTPVAQFGSVHFLNGTVRFVYGTVRFLHGTALFVLEV